MSLPSSPRVFNGGPASRKQAPTPELPLLEEAANELANLDEFQLLPAAAVDVKDSATPTTALPASPDNEESEDDGASVPGTVWPDGAASWAAWPQHAVPQLPVGCYMPMWCWTYPTEGGNMFVMPYADGMSDEPPEALDAEGIFLKFMCWAQPGGTSGVPAVTCAEAMLPQASPPPCSSLGPWAGPGAGGAAAALPTTLCIVGLPKELTQEDLLEVLDREELSGFYDFVFLLPASQVSGSQRSAVVNFTGHEHALSLAAKLRGKTDWGVGNSEEGCEVVWSSPLQGLDELLEAHREAEGPGGAPQLFVQGWPAPLPRRGH